MKKVTADPKLPHDDRTAWIRLYDYLREFANSINLGPTECFIIPVTNQTDVVVATSAVMTFRVPYAFTVTEVRASLKQSQSSGSIMTVDINEAGSSILSTKITIDNGEKSSTTAATQPSISDTLLENDAEITIDIDQAGSGGVGLVITIIGRRT